MGLTKLTINSPLSSGENLRAFDITVLFRKSCPPAALEHFPDSCWAIRMESGGPVPPEWVGSISEVLIGSADIAKRVSQLGKTLSSRYEGLNPLLMVVLKGSYMFASDLSRSMSIPHELEFIRASSYSGTESSGNVCINGMKDTALKGRHVIIIEDIVDTGLTLCRLYAHFEGAGAATIRTCSFLKKETLRRKADIPEIDFVAFHIPDKFVIGYGLDYEQQYRHLPFVGVYKQ